MKVQLRSATVDDAARVADMHSRSRVSATRGMLSDHCLDHEAKAEALALWPLKLRDLAAGAGERLIAERDKNAMGFIGMFKPDEHGSVDIDNLHAMPEHKGSGADAARLDEARRGALSFGATRLHLLVLDTNVAAIGFCESRGWKRVGRKNDRMGRSDVVARVYALVYALGLEPTLPFRHS